jgi:flagellar biosynthesis protein FlhB
MKNLNTIKNNMINIKCNGGKKLRHAMIKGKKGVSLNEIPMVVIILVVAFIVVGMGGLILSSISKTSGLDTTVAANLNSSANTVLGINTTWMPILIPVIFAVVIIGLLFLLYSSRNAGR